MKWAWHNGRTKRSGQLSATWAVLACEIECWPIWPSPAGR